MARAAGHKGGRMILAAGAAIQILTGVPAAWGVFQRAVCEEYALSEENGAMIFSFIICFFGIGCVAGGALQDRLGPRAAGLFGAAGLFAGFFGAGFLPGGSAPLLCAFFSAPVGLGCAFLYPAVMSAAQKWYSDRKGLATGVIGGAVGASGAVLTVLGRQLITRFGIRGALRALGCLMLLVCGTGALLLRDPPGTAAQKDKGPRNGGTHAEEKNGYTAREMLRTPQYWLVLAVVGLATPAVLLFSPVIVQLAQRRGLSETAALACIVVGSVFSAAGRLVMPWLSDRIGRRAADMLLFGALCGLSVWFAFAGGWQVLFCYSLLTFCYSGEAAVIPALSTDLFGARHAGVNYGLIALGMSAGSVGFPLLARALSLDSGRHWLAAAAAAAGFVCLCFLKPTRVQQSG